MKQYYVGIDIGGTKCAVVLGKEALLESSINSAILSKFAFPTEAYKGFEQALEKIFNAVDNILAENKITSSEVISIGISCGGPLNSKSGTILSPPNLFGWDNIHIVDIMEKRYGVSTFLQNDANACALAEWKFGAAQGYDNVIFLTCGTGMGAGLILNGRLYEGATGMAGEVGHLRLDKNGPVGFGKAGSFEGFCSGGGISQIAKTKVLEKLQMGGHPPICDDISKLDLLTAKTVADAAKDGDELAIEIYKISAEYLGFGISILIDIINPDVIVLGSIYARSEKLLYENAKKIIDVEAIKSSSAACRLLPSQLGDRLGDYAALTVAIMGRKP